MQIDELRIYAECLEQGLDFKDYFLEIDNSLLIRNIYLPKFKNEPLETDSALLKILKLKSFDLAISIVSAHSETPILLVEYSTAVPTDDHKMQRSDVYFWSGIFRIPVMKISPLSKNSFGKHGGGDKISNSDEFLLALSNNAIVYFIDFPHRDNVLLTSKQRLSCIKKNSAISNVLSMLIEKIKAYKDFASLYEDLLQSLKLHNGSLKSLRNIFVDSTRFSREGADIVVKINRFGHAMDPDRGILFFINMLFGTQHSIAKIIIERARQHGRESYKALFDGLSESKLAKINNLIAQGLSTQSAREIFTIATGINVIFQEVSPTHFSINDENFLAFLQSYTSNVYKSIFLTTKELRLYNLNNEILCKISWNPHIATKYKLLLQHATHTSPLLITPLDTSKIKEDIITFASVEIFQRLGCEILALSYPGAQGDRAILIGQGRNVKRIYIDLIASKQVGKFYVFLHENKEKSSDIGSDIEKLHRIKTSHTSELHTLLCKLHKNPFDELFLGVGFKYSGNFTSELKGIDYIFAFDLQTDFAYTHIFFSIGLINLELVDFFTPLQNNEAKLQGVIQLDRLYYIGTT